MTFIFCRTYLNGGEYWSWDLIADNGCVLATSGRFYVSWKGAMTAVRRTFTGLEAEWEHPITKDRAVLCRSR